MLVRSRHRPRTLAPWTEEDIAFIEAECQTLYERTDKAILVPFGGNIFEAGQLDFGYEEFFVNLLLEPDMMHYYFNRLADVHLVNLQNLLPRIAPYARCCNLATTWARRRRRKSLPKPTSG